MLVIVERARESRASGDTGNRRMQRVGRIEVRPEPFLTMLELGRPGGNMTSAPPRAGRRRTLG
jgi:hypothetical protein